jgi:beta-ureidopropionase / N-carbamoyl-L-amino-acid hydrolase
MTFEQMWNDLAAIGRDATSGGYHRPGFGPAERECTQWFVEQATRRELTVESDGNGNLLAWWVPHGVSRSNAILTGSHLDSVPDGGAFDGPLGVVSAFAAVDELRARAYVPRRPIAVAAFAEEEGSRFGLACLGSRLATGATDAARAGELRDSDGVFLLDAMAAGGVDPHPGRADWLDRVTTFVELHVEQGKDLVYRERPVAVASSIWPHGRWRYEFAGESNHAGTTRMEDRHDPMLTYAMTALAANKQARTAGARATFGRVEVEPNGTNAVPSRVRAWLDARAVDEDSLTSMVEAVERQSAERATRDSTTVKVRPESVSSAVRFDIPLARRLARRLDDAPVIATAAGHDAGILSASGVPTAMLFVRNRTGISHAPAEHADMDDCLTGVQALASVLMELGEESVVSE